MPLSGRQSVAGEGVACFLFPLLFGREGERQSTWGGVSLKVGRIMKKTAPDSVCHGPAPCHRFLNQTDSNEERESEPTAGPHAVWTIMWDPSHL